MIVDQNGFIQYKIVTGGGLDENGNGIPVTETWSELIPANIQNRKYDNLATSKEGSNYVACSYNIIIDLQEHEFVENEVIRVTKKGIAKGDHSVIYAENQNVVNETRILV